MKNSKKVVTRWSALLSVSLLGLVLVASAQAQKGVPESQEAPPSASEPVANPARPTVSTPATLTPVGYLQFETGFLRARHSPEFSSQSSFNEVVKLSVLRRLELFVVDGPFVHSRFESQTSNGVADLLLGAQAVVHEGEGAHPTVAFSYQRRILDGGTPDLDIGSASNSVALLASADVSGFHYDTNFLFNEVVDGATRRAQFGQTLSIAHRLRGKVGLSGEIWHFTQPFLRGHTVGNLWALNYNARKNLVFDIGFNRGLTDTSTRWEVFAGFTYLLPYKLVRH